jgi:hypothetical protein
VIKVSELKEGAIYRRTRSGAGIPNTYAMVVNPKRVARMRKRLVAKLNKSPQEARALGIIERGDVLMELYFRYTTESGAKKEGSSLFGLDPTADVALREVQRRPGYVHTGSE